MVLSEENIRTLVILVAIVGAAIWQTNKLEKKLDEKMDKKLDDFYVKLKTNDFAHLTNAISELTFILEKNGFLKTSDMNHINSRLEK
ncbi:hypothetical protein R83H12_01514 [Fibrobacteria bacterium R8-3-H12]